MRSRHSNSNRHMPESSPRRSRGVLSRRPATALPPRRRFWRQVNNHSVALISLFLAATSLGYNTWRNETTELQRNWRQASFQVLIEVGELNQIVLYRRYFLDTATQDGVGQAGRAERHAILNLQDSQSWVNGWGKVLMIRDLTSIMPDPLPERGQVLFDTWQLEAANLEADDRQRRQQAAEQLLESIEALRQTMVGFINELR